MKFTATASHSQGKSISHSCRKGIYEDPTDSFQETIEAGDVETALNKARGMFDKVVVESRECECDRKLCPGNDEWWNSVSIELWPQDEQAAHALDYMGFEWRQDDYGIVPAALRDMEKASP